MGIDNFIQSIIVYLKFRLGETDPLKQAVILSLKRNGNVIWNLK